MTSPAEREYNARRVRELSDELKTGCVPGEQLSESKSLWLDAMPRTVQQRSWLHDVSFVKLTGGRLVDMNPGVLGSRPVFERLYRVSTPTPRDRVRALDLRIEHELVTAESEGDIRYRAVLTLLRDMSGLVDKALTSADTPASVPDSARVVGHASGGEIIRDPRSWFIVGILGLLLLSQTESSLGHLLRAFGDWIARR